MSPTSRYGIYRRIDYNAHRLLRHNRIERYSEKTMVRRSTEVVMRTFLLGIYGRYPADHDRCAGGRQGGNGKPWTASSRE